MAAKEDTIPKIYLNFKENEHLKEKEQLNMNNLTPKSSASNSQHSIECIPLGNKNHLHLEK